MSRNFRRSVLREHVDGLDFEAPTATVSLETRNDINFRGRLDSSIGGYVEVPGAAHGKATSASIGRDYDEVVTTTVYLSDTL